MKYQTLMTLALAAVLAAPVAAQQTTNDQNAQPASGQQTSQNTAGQTSTDSTRQPLATETHEGFWGHLNPFARKKYVQRQMGPIRDRVNELDELTANNTKMIKDVDSRAQEGIRMADAKATQADQHAVDAGNRAQAANETATQAANRLGTVEQVVTNIDQYQPVNQTEIMFRPGQMALSKKAKDALDQMADNIKNQRGYVIEVQGFSSGRGQAAIQNSQQMADSVVRYLVLNHEVPVYRIYVLGMGNAPRQATTAGGEKPRRTTGGRVEISLLKNNLEQLSAQNANTTGAQGGMSGMSTSTPAQNNNMQQPATANPSAPAAQQQVPQNQQQAPFSQQQAPQSQQPPQQ